MNLCHEPAFLKNMFRRKWKTKIQDLDTFLEKLANKIHPKIGEMYTNNSTIRQFGKFSLVALVFGYLLNLPLVVLFTDVFHIWYGISLFLAAVIIHIIKFVGNKFWVFPNGTNSSHRFFPRKGEKT